MSKGDGRRQEDIARVQANLARVKFRYCPDCNSPRVSAEERDEDIEYADGIMAAAWTELECDVCGLQWQEGV